MCLANSDLSAFSAASTRSAITLSACSCASVLGGPDAHAATPHNSINATPQYGARLITGDTFVASSSRLMRCIPPLLRTVGRPGRKSGPVRPFSPAAGHLCVHAQNLKFSPVEKPCGWQPPQVVGPALL